MTEDEVTLCHSNAVLTKKHDGTDPSFTTLLSREIHTAIAAKLYTAQPAPAARPMTDEVRRSYQNVLRMNTPHGFGDRIGPFVQWLQENGIGSQPTAPAVPEVGAAILAEREACAVIAWSYYADTCKRQGVNPMHFGHWCSANAIRTRNDSVVSLASAPTSADPDAQQTGDFSDGCGESPDGSEE